MTTPEPYRPRAGQAEESIARWMSRNGIIMRTRIHLAPANPVYTILSPRLNLGAVHYTCDLFAIAETADHGPDAPHMTTVYSIGKDDPNPPRPGEVMLALIDEAGMLETSGHDQSEYMRQWYPNLSYHAYETDEDGERREELWRHVKAENAALRYLLELAGPEPEDPEDREKLYHEATETDWNFYDDHDHDDYSEEDDDE